MCHQHQSRAAFAVEAEDQLHHRVRGIAIEISCRFITEENPGTVDEGSGESHALLFTAGQLRRIMVKPIAQTHAGQQIRGFAFVHPVAPQFQRDEDIFQGGQRGDELEVLENKTHAFVPHQRPLIFRQSAEFPPHENHFSATGLIQPGAKAKQRRLAAAGWPDDGAGITG